MWPILWVWLLTMKSPTMANGAFISLHLSDELVKQFVQLYRQSSLCWRKKRGDTMFCSRHLVGERRPHTE